MIDSDPPGATVFLDDEYSGFATPCTVDINNRDIDSVRLELAGYRSAERILREGQWTQAILWREMSLMYPIWRFPLWLNVEDFFFPIKESDGEMPHRIYVRLEREGDSLR